MPDIRYLSKEKVFLSTNTANIDANFGPWDSIEDYEEWFALTGLESIESGTRIAVENSTTHKIKCYIRENGEWREDGGMTDEEKSALADLMSAVFPLTVAYGTKNNNTYEYGSSVTPSVAWTITRKGIDVASDSTVTVSSNIGGTLASDNKSYTGTAAALTSTLNFSASITQGGQTRSLSQISWTPSRYRYYGELSAAPSDYPMAIQGLSNRHLSEVKTLSATPVTAGKYFLFAVYGSSSVTLKAYHAETGGEITGCTTGSCAVPRRNDGSVTDTYYYILVPAGATNWNVIIKNS